MRYTSPDEDSARWDGFPFREGDIVISTRSKSGTTWAQMICALLVFTTPDLPAPLTELSPWLDHRGTPAEDVVAHLEAQRHRRFIKTHTPLDGVPLDDRATYIVVARHPLDMAVSLYHQAGNIDRARVRRILGTPEPDVPPPALPPLQEWLADWVGRDVSPMAEMDSLPGVLHHLSDAWARRGRPNVVLVHYDDLQRDLAGEMRRLASLLGVAVPEPLWARLVEAAGFAAMRARSGALVPDRDGIFKDPAAFFRSGTSGGGTAALSSAGLDRYRERVAGLAPADLLAWLHR